MAVINYNDIYAKTLLNDVKFRIRQNAMKLEGVKEKETDAKMTEVIKGLCIGKEGNSDDYTLIVFPTSSEEETERSFCTLMLYYTALYNDNLGLLYNLLNKGYSFGNRRYELDLFALDKRISSQFDENLYFDLLKNQSLLFKNFYHSLSRTDIAVTDEESIDDFCNILNKDPNVAYFEDEMPWEGITINDLLTKYSIASFGQELILKATREQKRGIIAKASLERLTDSELERVKALLNHEEFNDLGFCWKKTLEFFSDEEILMINNQERELFSEYYNHTKRKQDYEAIRRAIYSQEEIEKPNINIKKKILSLFNTRKSN